MTVSIANRLPESLIRELFESDRSSAGSPSLRSESRDLAVTWLRRILIDFEALDEHIALLQKLYGASFQYPRPRRDQWDMEQPLGAESNPAFTHADRLPDDQVADILDRGIDTLSNLELGCLVLNPVALFDLFDCVDDVQPEYWLDALHDLVGAQAPTRHNWPPYVVTKVPPEEASRAQPASGIADGTQELRHSLDSALAVSKQLSEVLVSHSPSRNRALQYGLALAATVGFIMVGWGVVQMSSIVSDFRIVQTQQAEIHRLSDENLRVRGELEQLARHFGKDVGLVPTRADQNRPVDWATIVDQFYDSKLSDEDNLKSLEDRGGAAARARIEELRKGTPKPSAGDILKELFNSWGGPTSGK